VRFEFLNECIKNRKVLQDMVHNDEPNDRWTECRRHDTFCNPGRFLCSKNKPGGLGAKPITSGPDI
jgi:hypothetical protein